MRIIARKRLKISIMKRIDTPLPLALEGLQVEESIRLLQSNKRIIVIQQRLTIKQALLGTECDYISEISNK